MSQRVGSLKELRKWCSSRIVRLQTNAENAERSCNILELCHARRIAFLISPAFPTILPPFLCSLSPLIKLRLHPPPTITATGPRHVPALLVLVGDNERRDTLHYPPSYPNLTYLNPILTSLIQNTHTHTYRTINVRLGGLMEVYWLSNEDECPCLRVQHHSHTHLHTLLHQWQCSLCTPLFMQVSFCIFCEPKNSKSKRGAAVGTLDSLFPDSYLAGLASVSWCINQTNTVFITLLEPENFLSFFWWGKNNIWGLSTHWWWLYNQKTVFLRAKSQKAQILVFLLRHSAKPSLRFPPILWKALFLLKLNSIFMSIYKTVSKRLRPKRKKKNWWWKRSCPERDERIWCESLKPAD